MAKIEVRREFAGKESGACYLASLRMVEKAGYQIIKKREIASLVICERNFNGQNLGLSVVVPFGFPISVILTLTSEAHDQSFLDSEAIRLAELLEKEVSVG
jgi:hypothetical protein